MSLEEYRRKRDPAHTPEPFPADDASRPGRSDGGAFVVQEHHARAHHFDFRLERDGVLVSWAIPKGMPTDPAVNHLAIPTEDHPLEYASFAGTIPKGEYGGGTMRIYDRGTYECVKWTPGDVKVILNGTRLTGGFALFRTGRDDDSWMIHRERQPLPTDLTPMMATAGELPASDAGWSYEMKWDGQRVLASVQGRQVRLHSRTGRDITASYPEIAALGRAAGSRQLLLDGEIVALAGGVPSFEALQERMHADRPSDRLVAAVPATYLVFDVLHVDGRPLLDTPYRQRRELLDGLGLAGPSWHTPPAFDDVAGSAVLAASAQQGLEGVIAKRADSLYRPGARSPNWRKIKNVHRQEVVVGGWRRGTGGRPRQIGSLHVGVYTADGFHYVGNVGTGFTEQTLRMLGERLAPLVTPECPFVNAIPASHARDATWVRPELVIEVEFARWTGDGKLRAPSYKGLRTDKDPAEVRREQ